jgi:hypothetical protein
MLTLSVLMVSSISLSQPTLAETILQTQGSLDNDDNRLSNGSFYESYTFSEKAEKQVLTQLTSNSFDIYLGLIDPDDQTINEDDDPQEIPNSAMTAALPKDGEYVVTTNSYDELSAGTYNLLASAYSPDAETLASSQITSTSAQVPASSSSCAEVVSAVEQDLAESGYYIPWETSLPYKPQVFPEVNFNDNRIQNDYYGYPPDRTQSVTFTLTGDSTRIYQGIMNSPQLMTTYASQIMASCSQVGLVEFQHWWEGVVPIGYFSDGTIRRFEWVSESGRGASPGFAQVRVIEASDGSALYPWGYYYSP